MSEETQAQKLAAVLEGLGIDADETMRAIAEAGVFSSGASVDDLQEAAIRQQLEVFDPNQFVGFEELATMYHQVADRILREVPESESKYDALRLLSASQRAATVVGGV